MKDATYVFDVCHTLFDEDTTLGLLRHHFAKTRRPLRRAFVTLLSARASPLRAALIVLDRLEHSQLAQHLAVRLLRGEQAKALPGSARNYAQPPLAPHRIPQGRDIILISKPSTRGTR